MSQNGARDEHPYRVRTRDRVLRTLDRNARTTDRIATSAGCTLGEAVVALQALERAGLVERGPTRLMMTWRKVAANA